MKITKSQLKRIIREEYSRILNEVSSSSDKIGNLIISGNEGAMQALTLVNDDLGELNREFGKYLEGLMKRVISAVAQVNPRAQINPNDVEILARPDIEVLKFVQGYGSIPVKNPTGAADENIFIGGSVIARIYSTKNEEHFDLSVDYNSNMGKVLFHLRQDTYTKSGRRRNRINKNYLDSERAVIDEVSIELKGKIR